MRRPAPLPRELEGRPFSTARAGTEGVSGARLRAADLEAPFSGVRVPRGSATTVAARARALSTVLGDGVVFSHLTAARLWPLELPREQDDEPLHVAVRHPGRAPRRRGVIGHSIADPEVRAVVRHGLRLTDGASLFCHLAPILRLADLVAVGDALLREPFRQAAGDRRPWVARGALEARVAAYRGPGAPAARRALTLVRSGAESRKETEFRLALLEAGMPEPELQVPVHDAAGFIGRLDTLYPRWKVGGEYEGDQHRTDRVQWDRDLIRYERLAAAGFSIVRIAAASFLRDPAGCAARVRARLLDAGWRPAP
ncbi:hypothetical protein EDF35_3554 [Rathayibacter sp. PhB151]|nr:hypothetical protein EDF35_3554 [Rathayibacter sp. PhB151]